MKYENKYCMVTTTCPDNDTARALASKLLKENLAACVQLSSITSFYTWQNEQHADPEIRLLIKTKSQLYPDIEAFIKKHHDYEVPQIIQAPITEGSDEYLGWIDENTKTL